MASPKTTTPTSTDEAIPSATQSPQANPIGSTRRLRPNQTIADTTLTATQDVTITQNSSTTGNYSNTEIYGSTSKPKIALIEFDLSNISSAKYIESAAFKPYATKLKNAPGTFSIYAAGTENWSQTSADWYDKPTKGKLLDTITISSTNQYVSFDVTEALQDAVDAGQTKITLWIEDSEQEQQRFDFASENNSSINKPSQLVISSTTEGLPTPIQGSHELNSIEPTDSNNDGFINDKDQYILFNDGNTLPLKTAKVLPLKPPQHPPGIPSKPFHPATTSKSLQKTAITNTKTISFSGMSTAKDASPKAPTGNLSHKPMTSTGKISLAISSNPMVSSAPKHRPLVRQRIFTQSNNPPKH